MSARKRSRPVKKQNMFEKKEMRLAITLIIAIIAIAAVIFSLYGNNNANNSSIVNNTNNQNNNSTTGNPTAIIDTSMGIIKVELYEDKVPNTVENFVKLADDGFYDGLVFHRVIDNFVIQGGGYDTQGNLKESPYGPIDLEINSELHHVDGAIAMARTSDPNSATSQFYICDGTQSSLDGSYAVFGVVTDGMDVVRAIASVETTTKHGMPDWPVEDVIINSITIEQ